MAQNDKKLSVALHISGSMHHMLFVVQKCKMITSPDFFLIFSKFLFFGQSAKNGPKWQNIVCCTPYLMKHVSYDVICGTEV